MQSSCVIYLFLSSSFFPKALTETVEVDTPYGKVSCWLGVSDSVSVGVVLGTETEVVFRRQLNVTIMAWPVLAHLSP